MGITLHSDDGAVCVKCRRPFAPDDDRLGIIGVPGEFHWLCIQTFNVGSYQLGYASGRKDAIAEAAKACDDADKSTHPADLADAIRALSAAPTKREEAP